MGGDGEAAAEVVDALVGGGFETDLVREKSGGPGEGGFHRGKVWVNLRFLGDHGGVDVGNAEPELGDLGDDALEEQL